MDGDALAETLEEAGLAPYEAAAYVALLDLGTAPATVLADESGVPGPRVYDVLDALEARGYVQTYEQDSIRARAHSPAEVLEDLRSRADRFEAAAEEVEDRWEQPTLEAHTASIVDRYRTVRQHARQFVDGADYQVQLCLTPRDYERLRSGLRAARERGVSVRATVHTSPDADPPARDRFEGVCTEARHRPVPAPFVAIVDREQSCFARNPESYDPYGLLVHDRTHTYVFHWYFLTCLWEGFETLYVDGDEELPVDFVEIRQFVETIAPLVDEGATVRARVEGNAVETGESVTAVGSVREVLYADGESRPSGSTRRASQVSVVLDTEEGPVTAGGWGAMLEEIEATRITVLDVTTPGGESGAVPFDRAGSRAN